MMTSPSFSIGTVALRGGAGGLVRVRAITGGAGARGAAQLPQN
jgi:hypothetical protein